MGRLFSSSIFSGLDDEIQTNISNHIVVGTMMAKYISRVKEYALLKLFSLIRKHRNRFPIDF